MGKVAIIGFAGGIGSGKDCAANIAEEYGYPKVGFADHLKESCAFLTGEDMWSREGKDKEIFKGVTGRKLLETIGALMRSYDKDFWVKQLFDHHKKCSVCDVRYGNEVKAIRDLGGVVIKIVREGVQRTGHESDNWEELDCDYVIENNGTLEEFKQKIRECIEHL